MIRNVRFGVAMTLLLCLGAVFAAGQAGGAGESPETTSSVVPEEAVPDALRDDLAARASAEPLSVENQVGTEVSDEALSTCAKLLAEEPQDIPCLALVERANGRLAPGAYTDEELRDALVRSGALKP